MSKTKKTKKQSPTEQLKQTIESQRATIDRLQTERETLKDALWDLLKDYIRGEIDERVDDRVSDLSLQVF